MASNTIVAVHEAAERELRIEIRRDDYAKFVGTAAQLVSEGLIPEGVEWPLADSEKRWEVNGIVYRLYRVRPVGHKGPKGSWLNLDNWAIRIGVIGRDFDWRTRRLLERQAEELRAAQYRYTDEGSREWRENHDRWWCAHEDKAYQAFKAKVPNLIPPRRGRPPKRAAATDSE